MENKLPRRIINMPYQLMNDLANIYMNAGGFTQYQEIIAELEPMMVQMVEQDPRDFQRADNPYIILRDIYESRKDYNKLVELFEGLQKELPDDPNLKSLIERYKSLADAQESKKLPSDTSSVK